MFSNSLFKGNMVENLTSIGWSIMVTDDGVRKQARLFQILTVNLSFIMSISYAILGLLGGGGVEVKLALKTVLRDSNISLSNLQLEWWLHCLIWSAGNKYVGFNIIKFFFVASVVQFNGVLYLILLSESGWEYVKEIWSKVFCHVMHVLKFTNLCSNGASVGWHIVENWVAIFCKGIVFVSSIVTFLISGIFYYD